MGVSSYESIRFRMPLSELESVCGVSGGVGFGICFGDLSPCGGAGAGTEGGLTSGFVGAMSPEGGVSKAPRPTPLFSILSLDALTSSSFRGSSRATFLSL